jgi:glutamate synthase domain-containing protein 3
VRIRLNGTAGQSFGAWLCPGVTLELRGTANDYVAKGMAGGTIAVTPARTEGVPHAAGNAVLYGATGGKLFLAGRAGQRFAVRNSGASTVVEGCSDHGCEYMTGGVVVVIGDVGRNFAAGMTGGRALVWDPNLGLKARLAETAPATRRPSAAEIDLLRSLLEEHHQLTSSPTAGRLLEDDDLDDFWVIEPKGVIDHPSEVILETSEAGD